MRSRLDATKIIQNIYDPVANAASVRLTNTEIAIALDAAEDSVVSKKFSISQKATVPSGTATLTVVVPAQEVAGLDRINIITNVTSAITATSLVCKVQVSPSLVDDVWIDFSPAISISVSSGVQQANIQSNIYPRARVVITHAGYSAGSFDVYLVGG